MRNWAILVPGCARTGYSISLPLSSLMGMQILRGEKVVQFTGGNENGFGK